MRQEERNTVAEIDPRLAVRTRQTIWLTLLVSQLIYVGIILSGVSQIRSEPVDIPVFPIVLGVVAATTAAASHVFWRRATGAGRALHVAPPEPAAAFTSFMLAWVFDESIAIYGFVLSILAFSAATWAPFSLAGFALLLVHRPS